jgi:hypothetical protein
MKSNFGGKSIKREIINNYVELRNEAIKEVSIDVMRQTVAIMLYGLSISEKGYSDDELREMFNSFVNIIKMDATINGERLRSDEITDLITNRLGIDLNEINPELGE